jgi:hypothetical protein
MVPVLPPYATTFTWPGMYRFSLSLGITALPLASWYPAVASHLPSSVATIWILEPSRCWLALKPSVFCGSVSEPARANRFLPQVLAGLLEAW